MKKKTTHFAKGKDAGNKKGQINSLITRKNWVSVRVFLQSGQIINSDYSQIESTHSYTKILSQLQVKVRAVVTVYTFMYPTKLLDP